MKKLLILTIAACLLWLPGCNNDSGGSNDTATVTPDPVTDDDDTTPSNSNQAPNTPDPATYTVELLPGASGLHQGKNQFQIRISDSADGSPVTGLAPSIILYPLMRMATFDHGNPVPLDAVSESSTPGTYDCTLFFSMPSVDMMGNSMGQWTLSVTVPGQVPTTLDMMVYPPVGTDTTIGKLQYSGDTLVFDSLPKPRMYLLFRDSLTPATGGDYKFKIFLATIQEGYLVFPPVVAGLVLKDLGGNVQMTINTLALQASSDGVNWIPMSCDALSRCEATLSGLTPAVPKRIYVKLKINGNDYTTDSKVPDGSASLKSSNAFAKFVVTP